MELEIAETPKEIVHNRQRFRIHYPIADQPKFIIDKTEFKIIDLSENGLRFCFDRDKRIIIKKPMIVKFYANENMFMQLEGTLKLYSIKYFTFKPVNSKTGLKKLQEKYLNRKESPVLVQLGGFIFERFEVTDDVIKFNEPVNYLFGEAPAVYGKLVFHDGESLLTGGEFLRMIDDEVIIALNVAIPYTRIMKEQRYLMKKYVGWD